MEEKTLLAEIEKEQEKLIEKKFEEHKKVYAKELAEEKHKPINIFSASAFPKAETEQLIEPKKEEKSESRNSSTIEKPNYDFIEELSETERKKYCVIEEEQSQPEAEIKPKRSRLKYVFLAIMFAIFGVWGIVNITQIDSISSSLTQATNEYNMNLITYMNNLKNLDATNSDNMQNLLDTIPDQELKATGIEKQSNWFDHFCNFIAGLFGG